MPTISTKPALLVPRLQARITFTPVSGNFVRVWVTDAPPGSDLRRELDATTHSLDPEAAPRIRITELKELKADGATSFEWTFTPDKGGKYLLAIQEYRKGTDFGGGFADDPNALQKEVEVSDEDTSKAVTVGQILAIPIGIAPDVATLRVCAHDDRIRATSLEVHGIRTPSLVEPESARATAAATSEAVTDALADLVDTSTSGFGSLASAVTDLMIRFNSHRSHAGHSETDTDNAISADYYSPDSPKALEEAVTELHRQLTFHMQNQDADRYGVGTAGFHSTADWQSLPGPMGANALSQIADLWRAFEAHRTSDVHASPDTTNAAASLPPILELARQFVTVAGSISPLTPATSAGNAVTTLVHEFGFDES